MSCDGDASRVTLVSLEEKVVLEVFSETWQGGIGWMMGGALLHLVKPLNWMSSSRVASIISPAATESKSAYESNLQKFHCI